MRYNHEHCEDKDDAARMAEGILRSLGYLNISRGPNVYSVRDDTPVLSLGDIARSGEHIARWARAESKRKGCKL
jgi:hypothetical protein